MDIKKHTKRLAEMQQHLASALRVANNSLGDNQTVSQAKAHIKQAMQSIEEVSKKVQRRSDNQPTPLDLWKNTVATAAHQPTGNAAYQPMSNEVGQGVMKNLDALISAEKKKLNEIKQRKLDLLNSPDLDITDFEMLQG